MLVPTNLTVACLAGTASAGTTCATVNRTVSRFAEITEGFGGKVIRAQEVMHGKTSPITHTGVGVFKDLPSPYTIIRYHSLAIERASLPDCLEITAWTADGEIMGVSENAF